MQFFAYDEESFIIHYQLNGQYLGYVTANWNYLAKIFVLKEYRERGIGSLLLKAAEEKIRSTGYDTIKLDAIPGDQITQKSRLENFYLRKGYRTEDGVRFVKNLL